MREYLYKLITGQKQGVMATLLKALLLCFSWFYCMGSRVVFFLYEKNIVKRNKLPKAVISVGNITWGGAGKTPFVIYLAYVLKSKGLTPAVLTRGYLSKKTAQGQRADEVLMLEEELKGTRIISGRDRYLNAVKYLKENNADVFDCAP